MIDLKYLKIIKEKVNRILKGAKVYVFGLVERSNFNFASDIDVLIACNDLDFLKRTLIKTLIYKK